MADYRKIAEEALRKANELKGKKPKTLNESLVYPEGLEERMHPRLEKELVNQETSLGKHPIFPEGDETSFEQIVLKKINAKSIEIEIAKTKLNYYKDSFDDSIYREIPIEEYQEAQKDLLKKLNQVLT